jgi:hypothetical protein
VPTSSENQRLMTPRRNYPFDSGPPDQPRDRRDVPASDIAFRPAVNYNKIVSPISRSGR